MQDRALADSRSLTRQYKFEFEVEYEVVYRYDPASKTATILVDGITEVTAHKCAACPRRNHLPALLILVAELTVWAAVHLPAPPQGLRGVSAGGFDDHTGWRS